MPAPVSGVPTPPRSSTFAFFQHQKLENPDSFTCDFHIHDPHPVKRHMDVNWQALLEDGAPLPKRKVDRMSARLDKVHISPGQNPHHTNWRKRHHRRETFEEIEQRLTDSSDDEMSDDNEPCSSKKEKVYSEEQSVQLSDELKKFIKRSIEKPVIIPSPSVMNAVVPYVPHRSFEEYSMNSRISEIAEDDTEWHSCIQPDGAVGSVSFPEESSSSDECPSGNGKRTDSEQSNFLAIVEVEEFPDENTDVEMDCS